MTPRQTEQRQIDAEVARRLSAQIAEDLLHVIDHHQRLDAEGPTFLRYVTLHAVVELLGHLLTEAIAADPEKARPWITNTLEQLALHVQTTGHRPQ